MSDTAMGLGLPETLTALVSQTFRAAKQSKALTFSDTELAIIKSSSGVPFQLRYCPALAKKPTSSPKREDSSKPKPDPFENPSGDLLVAHIPKSNPSHVIVLNKYPVIANHFILATKTSKPQTDLLEEDDLGIAYACVKAWKEATDAESDHKLFAFFNSGEHSGASQPHRHLQFLPAENMAGSPNDGWQLLMERMIQPINHQQQLYRDAEIPFVHYATRFGPDMTPETVHSHYLKLLRAAVNAVQNSSAPLSDESLPVARESSPVISYNLAMTTDMMAICPRRSESARIPIEGSESSIALNGTILGGTLMVKDEKEWDSLREDPALLDEVLRSIGYPTAENGTEASETKL